MNELVLSQPRPLFFFRILGVKLSLALNALKTLKKHLFIHFSLFMSLVLVLVGGGSFMFYKLFSYLLNQELIGPPLVEHLLNMVLLTFLAMLVFSNLIITLSTTYISKEIDYYMSQPVDFKNVFMFKLTETVLYSSWAFVILSFPLFLGYGMAKDLSIGFYLSVLLMMLPFLLIPTAIGAIITMVVAASIPAKRSRAFMCVVGAAAMFGSVVAARMLGFNKIIEAASWDDFFQFMQLLEAGRLQILPNTWLAEGTHAAARGDYGEVFYWFLVLLSTGLMGIQICNWLVGPLYYRGWVMSRGSSGGGKIDPNKSFFNKLDHTYAFLGRKLKALIGKDLRTFWRDPAQWSQLVILFGLLYIYVANIRSAAQEQNIVIFQFNWQILLSFLNMGATCFIVSIISTRFVYPMLSLEGKQFWVIGLAPIPRRNLILQKYFFCLFAILVLVIPLMILSNRMLRVPDLVASRSVVTLIALSAGLTSLAVGLGAMTPNFREDNPARIANGIGGTANIVLSLIYVSVIIALVSVPTYIELQASETVIAGLRQWETLIMLSFISINMIAIAVPLILGIRAWNRLEF
jgi:ABC-2 type transport system permease protein